MAEHDSGQHMIYSARLEGRISHPAERDLPSATISFKHGDTARVTLRRGDGHTSVGDDGTIQLTAERTSVDIEIKVNAFRVKVYAAENSPCVICEKPKSSPPRPYERAKEMSVLSSAGYKEPAGRAGMEEGFQDEIFVIVGGQSYVNGEIAPESRAYSVRVTRGGEIDSLTLSEQPLNKVLAMTNTGIEINSKYKLDCQTADSVKRLMW